MTDPNKTRDQLPELVSRHELAQLLRISPNGIDAQRRRGALPPGFKLGRRTFWKLADVQAWIEQSMSSKAQA
jgi:predicted DNA-binding transcriptional regulator AlpA